MNNQRMSYWNMEKIIWDTKPGDKLKIVFTDGDLGGDLPGKLSTMIGNESIKFTDKSEEDLLVVVKECDWGEYTHTYEIDILDNFDPGYFISKTVDQHLLGSIEKIK